MTQQNSNTLSFINSKFFAISVLAHAENFSAFFLTSHTKNMASPPAALIFLHNVFIASSEKNLAIGPFPSNFPLLLSRIT